MVVFVLLLSLAAAQAAPPAPAVGPDMVLRAAAVRAEGDLIRPAEKLMFHYDKGELRPESIPQVRALALYLNAHPEPTRVEVSGHLDGHLSLSTDWTSPSVGPTLSAKPLVEFGVDPARLEARGYGADRPIASNDTPEGRSLNRRVELRVLEREPQK